MKWMFISSTLTTLLYSSLSYATPSQWTLSLGGGAKRASVQNTISIDNGSGFPAPYNTDIYTTHRGRSGMVFLALSHLWAMDNPWLSSFEAGLIVEHINRIPINGRITQYALPDFENYTYQFNASSQQVLAYGKIHIFKPQSLNPFIQFGLGLSKTRISNYTEIPLPYVTPRHPPAFKAHNNHKLATQIGAGVDLHLGGKGSASLAYVYENLGQVRSGTAGVPWNQAFQLGHLRSQQLRIGLQIHLPS